MKLSIVATLYRSASHIEEFHLRCTDVARKLAGNDYEIILVNDGSPDNSLSLAIAMTEHDTHLVVVDLSRNFGHHKAMMTGLAHTSGAHVFLIDADLEERPEWLLDFAQRLSEERCDVVYGVQKKRKGSFFERISGFLFYQIFSLIAGLALPQNVVTARLMTKRYVQALLRHTEREIVIAGLWVITGFEQRAHVVKKQNSSQTTYTLRKRMSVLVNAITSFSNAPLIAIFYIGVIIFGIAAIYITYLFVQWTFFSRPLSGWTSVMASIWFLGGLIISMIGVVGIYLSKVFSESKRRPYTIVRQVYRTSLDKVTASEAELFAHERDRGL